MIEALRSLLAEQKCHDENSPVGAAILYLEKRQHQLDYRDAIRQDLPIGSGEVESAHRHILQKRLKIPGAGWRLELAEEMAQLRAMRANQRWNDFWAKNVPDHHFPLHPNPCFDANAQIYQPEQTPVKSIITCLRPLREIGRHGRFKREPLFRHRVFEG